MVYDKTNGLSVDEIFLFFGYGMGLILFIDFMAQDGQIVLAPTLSVASPELLVLPAIRERVARA